MIEKVVKTTQQMFRDGKENGPTMDSEGQPSRTRNSSQVCRKIGSTEAENGSELRRKFVLRNVCFQGGVQ